jgi:hypothetical protein
MRQIQIRFGRYQFGQNPNRASLFARVKDCDAHLGTESVLLCDDLMWDSQNFPRVLVRLDVF